MRIWLGVLLLPALASAQIYRWTDAHGQVHFSERPNASGAEVVEVRPQVLERDAATQGREERLRRLHEARRSEQQQAAENRTRVRQQQHEHCADLRSRLATLERGGVFYRQLADGSQAFISDGDIKTEVTRLREALAAACQ